jgi:hypothetical protein
MKIHEILTELTFFGSPCTKDCSGHMAGYKWGKKKGFGSSYSGDPRTPSFNNGVNIHIDQKSKGLDPISTGIRGDNGRFQKFQPEPKIYKRKPKI